MEGNKVQKEYSTFKKKYLSKILRSLDTENERDELLRLLKKVSNNLKENK